MSRELLANGQDLILTTEGISERPDAAEGVFDQLRITAETLPEALSAMGKGMGGIFIVLFVIYLVSVFLQRVFPPKENE